MKRTVAVFWILLLLTIGLAGCQQPGGDGYEVMFAGRPNIWDDLVYHQGSVVGRIVTLESGDANIAKVVVAIDGPYKDRLATNSVFYVSSGRICLGKIGNYGTALNAGAAIIGFQSEPALRWFKFKNILDNPAINANKRAQYLLENF